MLPDTSPYGFQDLNLLAHIPLKFLFSFLCFLLQIVDFLESPFFSSFLYANPSAIFLTPFLLPTCLLSVTFQSITLWYPLACISLQLTPKLLLKINRSSFSKNCSSTPSFSDAVSSFLPLFLLLLQNQDFNFLFP